MKLKLKPFFLVPVLLKRALPPLCPFSSAVFCLIPCPCLPERRQLSASSQASPSACRKVWNGPKLLLWLGLFGLAFYYFFGANLLVMGLAVIALIVIFHKLGWEEGIVLASLTVIAIMSDDSGDPFLYILGRVTSTLIGIAVATLTNIVVVRPRHEPVFRRELKELTNIFPELYVKAVGSFCRKQQQPCGGSPASFAKTCKGS